MVDENKHQSEEDKPLLPRSATGKDLPADFLLHVVETIPDLIFTINLETLELVYSNRDIFSHFGWDLDYSSATPAERNEQWGKMLHQRDFTAIRSTEEFLAELDRRGTIDDVVRFRSSDGRWLHYQARCTRLSAAEHGIELAVVVARDVSQREKLDKDQRMAAKVFENSDDGIMILDAQSRVVQVNPALLKITGFNDVDLLGRSPIGIILPQDSETLAPDSTTGPEPGLFHDALTNGFSQNEGFGIRRSGDSFHSLTSVTVLRDNEDRVQTLIITMRDITESKTHEERIRHLAYFDALTRLPNRTLFHDRLEHELQRCERNNFCAALLFLDLDQFKAINDSLGHAAGDKLLKIASERLTDNVRGEDTVARMSGDEFTIILNGQSSRDHVAASAAHVARKILRELCEPFNLEGNEAFVSVSIGISIFPDDGKTSSMLLRNADTAMYFAKEAGKNNFQFYTPEMNAYSAEQLAFQNSLHKAVADQEFEVYYQPQYDYQTGSLRTVESLLRWRHPDGSLVSPMRFIPLAEQTGLIIRMGEWLIERSLWQFAEWRSMGLPVDRLAINLSTRQFGDDKLVHLVSRLLKQYDIPATSVEFELTESVIMADISVTRAVLEKLKALGVSIVIDDFGTGYSSLNYLKELPIDALKIDGSFVASLPGGLEDQQIVKVIVALAEGFDLRVIAEGVETDEQSDYLKALGCSAAQGYLFSGPKPSVELEQFLRLSDLSANDQKHSA